MRGGRTAVAVAAGILVLAAVAYGVLSIRGSGPGAVRGVALGVLLGAGGSVLEAFLVRHALRQPRGPALRIILGGFLLRLVLLVVVSLAAESTGFADGAAFALCFLGGFLASIPVLGAAVVGHPPAGNGEVRG